MTTIVRRRRLGMSSVRGISQFSETGIRWVRSDRTIPEDDIYIRWGCTSDLPRVEDRMIVNEASAIHQVNDKAGFRVLLDNHELCPRTWLSVEGLEDVGGTVILRPTSHSRGRNLWVYNIERDEINFNSLVLQANYLGDYYISEYIPKVAEYRVCVVQGRAVWVAQKTPGNPDDVAWNVARGGRFDNVTWDNWPLKVVRYAIEAFNLSELDFGGVDVMVDGDGNCYVIEINSAPSLTSPYRQTCMARAFDWIVRNRNKERIPLIEDKGGYRKFIHPAICDRAIMVETD